jgi:transcriptional regulator with XRE-family HTH domain
MSNTVTPISKQELLEYQADVKGSIFRQIRLTFARLKQSGLTQKDLATKIGMNEGQLSRRLRGDYDLRLETLSDLARGLDCRIDVKLTPLPGVARGLHAHEGTPRSRPHVEIDFKEMIKGRAFKEAQRVPIRSCQRRVSKGRFYSKAAQSSRKCWQESDRTIKLEYLRPKGRRNAVKTNTGIAKRVEAYNG